MTSNGQLSSSQWVQLLQTFSAKFVTDVLGGAGSIWSFFEALGLRTASNSIPFWKPVALSIGFIFFCRWIFQIQDFMKEASQQNAQEKQKNNEESNSLM